MRASLSLLSAFALGAYMSTYETEMNCSVTVNADQISGTNKQVFETLQEAVNEYMNTTVFTNAQFSANEKIECRLFFTIKEYADDAMKGDLQVQSLRPVYNSSYTTTLLNFKRPKAARPTSNGSNRLCRWRRAAARPAGKLLKTTRTGLHYSRHSQMAPRQEYATSLTAITARDSTTCPQPSTAGAPQ